MTTQKKNAPCCKELTFKVISYWGKWGSFKGPFILWVTQRCCCMQSSLLDLNTSYIFHNCFFSDSFLTLALLLQTLGFSGSWQWVFLINPSTLGTKDFKGDDTWHAIDIKGCFYVSPSPFHLWLPEEWWFSTPSTAVMDEWKVGAGLSPPSSCLCLSAATTW